MKIFAVSDIHGYYDEFIKALTDAGFERDNPNHLLVGCGDYFDRGTKPKEVMDYLMSLKNAVLVKGNHEYLMEELLHKKYPERHDKHNGTYDTLYYLTNTAREDIPPYDKAQELIKPFYDSMVDYFETEKYIFVHGWIPMNFNTDNSFSYYGEPSVYNDNWRDGDWETACWLNGFEKSKKFNNTGKTVVIGHMHCSYGWSRLAQERPEFPQKSRDNWLKSFEPYFGNGIIGIDACTAYTGIVNVVVLEDEGVVA